MILHADRLVSFQRFFAWSRIVVVIIGLFHLTGYELAFHRLMASTFERPYVTSVFLAGSALVNLVDDFLCNSRPEDTCTSSQKAFLLP